MHATDLSSGAPPTLRLVEPPSEAARDAGRDAIGDLYETEFARLSRLAYLLCGDGSLADDLAHDAFVRLYEHWDRVAEPAKRVAYLRTIVVNLAHSAHRRSRTARRHADSPFLAVGGAASSAEDEALQRSSRPDVMAALGDLPARQRTAVVLRHWLRMTEGEIAEAMGCSIGSVRTHITRGHHTLAQRLGGIR